MNEGPLRICIVTFSHISQNPRVVKEADALTAAGHVVRVIARDHRRDLGAADADVMRSRVWPLVRVATGGPTLAGRWRRAVGGALQVAARWFVKHGARHGALVDRAMSRHARLLARVAATEPAALVIGHTLAALPAAAKAAEKLGARLGFDSEDFHSGEMPNLPMYDAVRWMTTDVERRYLPRCDYLTAASDGIADAVATAYKTPRPYVALNVFPRALRPPPRLHKYSAVGELPKLYWYSMVIGPDRGLDDALRAMEILSAPLHLYIRGVLPAGYSHALRDDVRRYGLSGRVHVLPPVLPDDLVRAAAEYDIGLALEVPMIPNRALCVTNKFFTYMLAGLAIAATDTPGQRGIMDQIPGTGFVYAAGDAAALAAGLRALVEQPGLLQLTKERAWDAADRRFCWDIEQRGLVEYLTSDRVRRTVVPALNREPPVHTTARRRLWRLERAEAITG